MERTLAIIKPDGVAANLVGEVIRRLEVKGLRPVATKMIRLSPDQASGFYHVHRRKDFFESLVSFMSSGPVVAMILEGENAVAVLRATMGATDPAHATDGTIRRDFASSIEKNVIHGSDSLQSAVSEIGYFFSSLEICCR